MIRTDENKQGMLATTAYEPSVCSASNGLIDMYYKCGFLEMGDDIIIRLTNNY
jgi:hypothetical protein